MEMHTHLLVYQRGIFQPGEALKGRNWKGRGSSVVSQNFRGKHSIKVGKIFYL